MRICPRTETFQPQTAHLYLLIRDIICALIFGFMSVALLPGAATPALSETDAVVNYAGKRPSFSRHGGRPAGACRSGSWLLLRLQMAGSSAVELMFVPRTSGQTPELRHNVRPRFIYHKLSLYIKETSTHSDRA